MKNQNKFFAILLVAFAAFACKEPETPTTLALGTETDANITLATAGGTKTIAFTTNVAWSAVSDVEWLTIDPASGVAGDAQVTLTVAENKTFDVRTGKVTITANDKVAEIGVTQSQVDAMNVTADEYYYKNYYGGKVEVSVEANVDYEIVIDADCDWVTAGAATKGLTTTTAVVEVAANSSYAYRETEVKIVADGFETPFTIGQGASVWSVDMNTTAFERAAGSIVSIAVLGDNLVVANGLGAVKLIDKTTGEAKGDLALGDLKVAFVKNDDAGNLVLCNHNAYSTETSSWTESFKVWKMSKSTDTPTLLIEYSNYGPLGSTLAVRGDVNSTALIASPYEGIDGIGGANEVVFWNIASGKADDGTPKAVTGFPGLAWLTGYWFTAPENVPAIGLYGTSLNDGFLFSMYDEDKVRFVGSDLVSSVIMGPADANYLYNCMDVRSLGGHSYAVICPAPYWPQWGCVPALYVVDVTDHAALATEAANVNTTAKLVFCPETTAFLAEGEEGVSPSTGVALEATETGVNFYYIDHNNRSIEAFFMAF